MAIAGRNGDKLAEVNQASGADVEIIIADADDVTALEALAARTKVVLSTAGPFHRYGSHLVAACVSQASHYVDITGENFWVKGLIEKHHEEAARKGVRIIPSCGFDSIPSDLGSFFAIQKSGQAIKRVESFHAFKGDASGGTLETIFSMPELNLGDDLTNPFLLNPEGTITPEMEKQSVDVFGVAAKSEITAMARRLSWPVPIRVWCAAPCLIGANAKTLWRGFRLSRICLSRDTMERDKRADGHGGTRHGVVHPFAQIGAPPIKAARRRPV